MCDLPSGLVPYSYVAGSLRSLEWGITRVYNSFTRMLVPATSIPITFRSACA